MADIGLVLNDGLFDIDLQNGVLNYAADDFIPAIALSIGCNLGSYWADGYNEYSLGSLLHILRKTPVVSTSETILKAIDYATSATKWLVTGKYVRAINITASMPTTSELDLYVLVYEWNNPTPVNYTVFVSQTGISINRG